MSEANITFDFVAIVQPWVDSLTRIVNYWVKRFQDAGLIPPPCDDLLAGTKWRSPVDGQQWRVAGRPGNRHWIKSGPRGPRR